MLATQGFELLGALFQQLPPPTRSASRETDSGARSRARVTTTSVARLGDAYAAADGRNLQEADSSPSPAPGAYPCDPVRRPAVAR